MKITFGSRRGAALKDEGEINDASFLEAQPWYNGCRSTVTGWTVKHDLVLLRGSLEVGYSPWNNTNVTNS